MADADTPPDVMVSVFPDVRNALAQGRRDAQLLDARDFDPTIWDKAERELEAVQEVMDAAVEVCERLDRARDFNEEHERRDAVRQIDFAIGATLSLRSALAQRQMGSARRV